MEFTSLVLSVISVANMVVLGILIVMFTKIYVKTKAELPIGMIIVASLLFLHNIIGATGYFTMDSYFVPEIFPYLLGVGIAELVGLVVFLKISFE